MARKQDILHAGRDELMIDVQVLCSDLRGLPGIERVPGALDLLDRIDDLAHLCNGARNAGREEYLSCGHCAVSERAWRQGYHAGVQMYGPRKRAN